MSAYSCSPPALGPVILHWRRSHFPQIIALLRCMRGPLRQYGQHHSVCGVSWWTGSTGASNLECVLKLSAYYYANGFDSAALSLHFSATKCSGTSVVPGCTQCIAVHAQKKKNWPACSLFRMPGRNKRRLCGSHSGAGAFDILESLSECDTENAPETARMCSPGMCVPQRAHVQYSPGERAFVLCGVSLLINIFTLQSMFLQFGRYACLSLTARNAVEPHVLYFLFYFR